MISHPHRCIFVHIPKTGGTSIERIIWPPEERTEANLHMGFMDRFHNKYQTGGLQHLLARQVRAEVGAEVYDDYVSFAIVRNPWDRAVSQFTYLRKRRDLREFVGMAKDDPFPRYLELIRTRAHVQWIPQAEFVHDESGAVMVDHVGRFETFAETVREILGRLGLDDTELPHEKRSDRGPYQDYYDDETREQVADLYAADVAAFGYTFE